MVTMIKMCYFLGFYFTAGRKYNEEREALFGKSRHGFMIYTMGQQYIVLLFL
jgi:hypothetical protein